MIKRAASESLTPKMKSLKESTAILCINTNRFFKAKRNGDSSILREEAVTQETSEINGANKGIFKLNSGLTINQAPATTTTTFSFKFNFTPAVPATNKPEDAKSSEQPYPVFPNFIRSMKLNDEKKFIVSKNLFEDNSSNLLLKPLTETNKPKTEQPKSEESQSLKQVDLVSQNPLSSSKSIKLHKKSLQDHESPVVRSLFDFDQNKQYKKESIP